MSVTACLLGRMLPLALEVWASSAALTATGSHKRMCGPCPHLRHAPLQRQHQDGSLSTLLCHPCSLYQAVGDRDSFHEMWPACISLLPGLHPNPTSILTPDPHPHPEPLRDTPCLNRLPPSGAHPYCPHAGCVSGQGLVEDVALALGQGQQCPRAQADR